MLRQFSAYAKISLPNYPNSETIIQVTDMWKIICNTKPTLKPFFVQANFVVQ